MDDYSQLLLSGIDKRLLDLTYKDISEMYETIKVYLPSFSINEMIKLKTLETADKKITVKDIYNSYKNRIGFNVSITLLKEKTNYTFEYKNDEETPMISLDCKCSENGSIIHALSEVSLYFGEIERDLTLEYNGKLYYEGLGYNCNNQYEREEYLNLPSINDSFKLLMPKQVRIRNK